MHLLHDRAGGVSRDWPEGDLDLRPFAQCGGEIRSLEQKAVHRLRDWRIGEGAFLHTGRAPKGRTSGSGSLGEQRFAQAGLADACFSAYEQTVAAPGIEAPESFHRGSQLLLSPHHRRRGGDRRHGCGSPRDLLIQGDRLRCWPKAELLSQQSLEARELTKRRCAVPCLGVGADQSTMSLFVQL